MQRNENSTAYTLMKPSSSVTSHTADIKKFLDHWAWEFYTYIFVALFGVFALSCFVVFVREWTQLSPSRNIHGRFTTAQLLIAAMLKVVALLWSPILLKEASRKRFAASLLIDSLSIALTLSAFSILLLILLETTKTSLAAPKLQNIRALLAITAVLTAATLTFNLLVLYAERKFWHFVSYSSLFIWGILICVGYIVAGYRMWRNLKSSRQLGHSTGKGRLKRIVTLVFLAPFITAASLILNLCLAGSHYGVLLDLEISKEVKWSRYTINFLLRLCNLVIMVLIFGIVTRTKSRSTSVDDTPALQLGTFTEDTSKKQDAVSIE